MGFYPFDKPNFTDNRYKLIMKKDFNGFWKKCEKIVSDPNFAVSSEFKIFLKKWFAIKLKKE